MTASLPASVPARHLAGPAPARTDSRRRGAWPIAALVVAVCWLVGRLGDPQGVAFGQTGPGTVPSGPVKVSASAGTVAKRRPQLAFDSASRVVYMVWEEGTGNSTDLYYSWRDPSTGNWDTPRQVTSNADAARWPSGTGEFFPHIQVDPNGNLHVVFGAERSGTIGRGAYYTVGSNLTAQPAGSESWTTPLRLDCTTAACTSGSLQNLDNTRLYVRDDPGSTPGGVYPAVGYVLWTGNTDGSNKLRLSRVGYNGGTVTRIDPDLSGGSWTPLSNPVSTSVGPVAVLRIDNSTLQLVYAGKNLASGNGFWGASLALNTGPGVGVSWSATRAFLAGTNGDDCSVAGCTGATAVRDSSTTWIAANFDQTSPAVAHAVQVTMNGVAETLTDARAGRQPVIVYNSSGTGNMVLVYNQCTYVSASSCTSKDLYYRVHPSAGSWGAANATGPTTGEQRDIAALVVEPDVPADVGPDLHYAWVGNSQSAAEPGDQVYFQVVQAP